MAYQLTNATSVEDLLNKIAAFAVIAGWTERRNTLAAGVRTVTLQKSGDNINFWTPSTSELRVRGAVGYDSGAAANAQPDQAVSNAICNLGTGPFSNVFMFAGNSPAEYVHVVVEIASGIFREISFGELVKFGTFTGGTFFDAVNWQSGTQADSTFSNSHHRLFDNGTDSNGAGGGGVRCDVDGNANYFAPFRAKTLYATPVASGGVGSANSSTLGETGDRLINFATRSINNLTGNTPLQPITVRVERADNYWSNIGEVPGIRFVNMERFNPGDEFTIGSDVWKVFPWIRKAYVGADQPYSGNYAFAFLKVL